ncbi:hypothetical protein [Wenyingzhuangia sp. IMCC45574]
MTKKITLFTTILFIAITSSIKAQINKDDNKFLIGAQITQSHEDTGLGFNVTSPMLDRKNIALRLRGDVLWKKIISLDIKDKKIDAPYSKLSLGVVGFGGELFDATKVYGEGGLTFIFPTNNPSSDANFFGGYGVFGLEYKTNYKNYWFLEIGGIGTGGTTKSISANGVLFNFGYRYKIY